jgi:outer membrane lipoprotein carrier protein
MRILRILLVLFLPAHVLADQVSDYFSGLETVQADFEQTVLDAGGEEIQHSVGKVWIQRPGQFRWDYRTPYRQLIVADGTRLWTYDEDLEQATVKPLDEALSSTPAVLLSGYRPLSEVMDWKPDTDNDRFNWYRLTPKSADAAVERVRIAFESDLLKIIEVVDGFDNHTRISFSNIVRNRKLDADLFHLQLPEGTDIIGAGP